MPVPSFPSLATLALLAGAVGCASTTVRTDDSPSAAARDTTTTTTTAADTAAVQTRRATAEWSATPRWWVLWTPPKPRPATRPSRVRRKNRQGP